MKISVITITLNPGAALTRTMESIAAQTYPHIEWIVVDGGSTDGTLGILNGWRQRIARLITEPDEGIADAMNKGIAEALGDGVMFMHAGDEYCEAGTVSHVVSAWDMTRFDWATGAGVFISRNGKALGVRHVAGRSLRQLLQYGCRIVHPSTVVRRSLFEEYGGFDRTFRIAMDYELWLRLVSKGLYPQLLAFPVARFWGGGRSSDGVARFREDIRARRLHTLGNPFWIDFGLRVVAQAKRALSPLRTSALAYQIKERLRL